LKTKKFGLWLVPAVSAALLTLGCGNGSGPAAGTRSCVDAQGRRVPDNLCDDRNPSSSRFYHWYHTSHSGTAYVSSSSSAAGDHSSSSSSHPSGISRGGFGSSAHASAHAGG